MTYPIKSKNEALSKIWSAIAALDGMTERVSNQTDIGPYTWDAIKNAREASNEAREAVKFLEKAKE